MGQALKNNQEPSFIRLWKWHLLRLNQSSLKPKAPITISVEVRSQLETESADRDRCGATIATLRLSAPIGRVLSQSSRPLKENFAPVATLSQKLTPDAAAILSLAHQAQKIKS
jgi:hypothetical protein